uniref:Uncharacterized protein n=1 Tax=Oncorhynchus tshawytscha TaxID=74940 RepID=A0A8C8CLC6_ONCTS
HEKEAFHKQFSKLSPQSKVENYVDREFTLPSHLSPEISAVCIYLYKRGQVTEVRGYKGRLSLITQERERVYICQVIHVKQLREVAVGLNARNSVCSCIWAFLHSIGSFMNPPITLVPA